MLVPIEKEIGISKKTAFTCLIVNASVCAVMWLLIHMPKLCLVK